jgi:hypothetical protein
LHGDPRGDLANAQAIHDRSVHAPTAEPFRPFGKLAPSLEALPPDLGMCMW